MCTAHPAFQVKNSRLVTEQEEVRGLGPGEVEDFRSGTEVWESEEGCDGVCRGSTKNARLTVQLYICASVRLHMCATVQLHTYKTVQLYN